MCTGKSKASQFIKYKMNELKMQKNDKSKKDSTMPSTMRVQLCYIFFSLLINNINAMHELLILE